MSLFVFRRRQKSEIYRRSQRFAKNTEVCCLSRGFLSFHDNASPHSAAAVFEAMRRLIFGFSQTPELAPSDYHMLGSLKEALRGQRFAIDDKVKDAVHACLLSELPADEIRRLVSRYTICFEKGDYCVE